MSEATKSKGNSIREVVAVFHNAEKLEAAADALIKAGYPERRLSVLGDKKAIAERLGHHFEPVSTGLRGRQAESAPRRGVGAPAFGKARG